MTRTPHTTVTAALLAGLAVAAIYLAWTYPALSHEATSIAGQPLGWKYPYQCCSDKDCRAVTSGKTGAVRETDKGYVIAASGEFIPYGSPVIKQSPDQDFHWCSVAGLEDSRTICLFVPNRGF